MNQTALSTGVATISSLAQLRVRGADAMPMEQLTDSKAAGVLYIRLVLKTGVFNLWNFQCV